jgi:hypothetical protein
MALLQPVATCVVVQLLLRITVVMHYVILYIFIRTSQKEYGQTEACRSNINLYVS